MQLLNQEQIEKMIRDVGEPDVIEWANIMQYVRVKVRYGEIKLIIHDGSIKTVEQVKIYYKPSEKSLS